MKTSTTALVLTIATLASESAAQKCNADNCARAVTGTFRGAATYAEHLADCSSFQEYYASTVTPATFTTTATAVTIEIRQRDVETNIPRRNAHGVSQRQCGGRGGGGAGCAPGRVPTYASACSGTSRYASACSCAGITPVVTTLETPTETVTVTRTVRVT